MLLIEPSLLRVVLAGAAPATFFIDDGVVFLNATQETQNNTFNLPPLDATTVQRSFLK